MDTEDSSSPAPSPPLAQLTAQTPAIVKSIVKQRGLAPPPPEPDPEPFVEEGLTSAALVCLRRAV
jgi:hypothetical protein